MSILDIVIIAIVVICVAFAVRVIGNNKKQGKGCCGNCSGCSGCK